MTLYGLCIESKEGGMAHSPEIPYMTLCPFPASLLGLVGVVATLQDQMTAKLGLDCPDFHDNYKLLNCGPLAVFPGARRHY